ncbi:alpha/beta hydrolase family protein [Streptomyces sp. GF20]|uniref:alpha/beta hydrolase family protein n=1 Tax=Streptomyces sp. GF20 TaxID=2692235 RepID=UPI002E27D345|nr:prolyl oligopeptidase family serine peptidase [Streptomyces sp. GF20]
MPCHLMLPLVGEGRALLLVNGGSWSRDSWCFDPEAQLLANCGYAVLPVNFRGSTGYGKAHTQAAIGQFEGRMHDDLTDALDWAVGQSYADHDRTAILGCFYGGYTALVRALFTPDWFAAAVSYTGMSDLVDLGRSVIPIARRAVKSSYLRYIGDPDAPARRSTCSPASPIGRVDDIAAPMLPMYGASGVRVARRYSDRVGEALRSRGAETEAARGADGGVPERVAARGATRSHKLSGEDQHASGRFADQDSCVHVPQLNALCDRQVRADRGWY